MSLFEKLTFRANNPSTNIGAGRQYRLLNLVSTELILLSLLLICVDLSLQLWFLFYIVVFGATLTLVNLYYLNKSKNTRLCSHILIWLGLIAITIANFWIGGISSSYFSWYYVIIVLAAILINWVALVGYTGLIFLIVLTFAATEHSPILILSAPEELLVDIVNRCFTLLIIATSLYSLLRENEQYENLICNHNYLLQADKEKFHYLARYDSLTNLPNRLYFQSYMQAVIDTAKTKKLCATVFFMDLDRLKEINDLYGHDAGDALLLETSKRLQFCFREHDFLARLGGDEFTAIISHLNEDNVSETIAKRIILEFNKPFAINGIELSCRVSIGLASYPADGTRVEELIKVADDRMYNAKKSGGNDYRLAKTNRRTHT